MRSLVIVTVPPPVFDRMTTHVEVADEPLPVTGPQVSDVIVAIPLTASEAEREAPLNSAVMVAVWSAAAAATIAVNVAVVPSGAMETEAGTLTEVLLLEIVTVPPPVFDMVMAHVLDWDGATLAGLQVTEVMVSGPKSESDADRDTPFNEAEMLAF